MKREELKKGLVVYKAVIDDGYNTPREGLAPPRVVVRELTVSMLGESFFELVSKKGVRQGKTSLARSGQTAPLKATPKQAVDYLLQCAELDIVELEKKLKEKRAELDLVRSTLRDGSWVAL